MIFFEGLGDLALPCAAALVIPGLAVAIGARGRVTASLVFALTAGLGLWARAARLLDGEPQLWTVAALLVAGGVALVTRRSALEVAGSVAAGAAAAWMWEPCVGVGLGEALTTALYRPPAAVVPLVAYTLGLLSLVVVGAVVVNRTRLRRFVDTSPGRWTSLAVLLILAAAAAGGWYGDVVSALVRLSNQA